VLRGGLRRLRHGHGHRRGEAEGLRHLRLPSIGAPEDGTRAGLTAPATFSLLAPAYCKKFGVDDATFKEAMTRIAWKNHKNRALNRAAQFRKELAEGRDRLLAARRRSARHLRLFRA
jgi:acetyl-CoA acetyltransferase